MGTKMGARTDFLYWLSTKLYLSSVGMYATIIAVMALPSFFIKAFGFSPFWAGFTAFFIAAFLRATYESLVIYEVPVKNLSLHKMLILTLVTSGTMSLVSIFLKPKLGYFSIPVALLVSIRVVGKLKASLWPATQRPGFFSELPAKLDVNKLGMYGFYGFLVGITYMAYGKYNIDFNYAFAGAFFVGMMFEELYNATALYEQKVNLKLVVLLGIWVTICAVLVSAMVWVLMQQFGFTGQTATIMSVILLKLIQPLGSRNVIFRLAKNYKKT